MVKITHPDGSTVEYQTIDDPDEPAGIITAKNVKRTITSQENVEQIVTVNLAHISTEDIEQQFDEDVAAAIQEEIDKS